MARHRGAGPAGGYRPSRVRRGIASAFVHAGRVLLVGGPLWIAWAIVWGSGEDVAVTAGLVACVLVVTSPLLLLPCTSMALLDDDGTSLRAQTVLGRRVVSQDSLRVSAFRLPGEGFGTAVLRIRDRHGRRLVVLSAESWSGPWDGATLDAEDTTGTAPSMARRFSRWLTGWVMLLGLSLAGVVAWILVSSTVSDW